MYAKPLARLPNLFSVKTVILLIMHGSILAVTIPLGDVTQYSPGVWNCVDCLVPGGKCGNRNTRCARGLVPSLQTRRAVLQDGVRNFAGNTQGLILNTWIFAPSPAPFFNLRAPTILPNETPAYLKCWFQLACLQVRHQTPRVLNSTCERFVFLTSVYINFGLQLRSFVNIKKELSI